MRPNTVKNVTIFSSEKKRLVFGDFFTQASSVDLRALVLIVLQFFSRKNPLAKEI